MDPFGSPAAGGSHMAYSCRPTRGATSATSCVSRAGAGAGLTVVQTSPTQVAQMATLPV